MRPNRRNLYRVLHVQPEAPTQVISASYQVLMAMFDSDPSNAANAQASNWLKEAWQVLGNPTKRAAYDKSLDVARFRHQSTEPLRDKNAARINTVAASHKSKQGCIFCGNPLPLRIGWNTRCASCTSPLAPVLQPSSKMMDLLDRRSVTRVENRQAMTVYTSAQAGPLTARLKDVSTGGVCLIMTVAVKEGQIIRIATHDFEALARVASARRRGHNWAIGLQLMTSVQTNEINN